MRALVLAAGLGTRLRPWTLTHPKALVPVAGVPVLERVLGKLEDEGFTDIAVNIHHFGEQIIDFLSHRRNKARIVISDEREALLDTGGGILQAAGMLEGEGPLLVHNADILSSAPLRDIVCAHLFSGAAVTLLTSGRNSTRRLVFDDNGCLHAWLDTRTGSIRPETVHYVRGTMSEEAFSGIYVVDYRAVEKMREWAPGRSFPIMDFLLHNCAGMEFRHFFMPGLRLLDIGKPDSLACAGEFVRSL